MQVCVFLSATDESISIYPKYVKPYESFTIICNTSYVYDAVISREWEVCASRCNVTSDCYHSDRMLKVTCDYSDRIMTLRVSGAIKEDFTQWTCAGYGGEDTDFLEEFGNL